MKNDRIYTDYTDLQMHRVADVEKIARLCHSTIYNYMKDGRLKSVKVGGGRLMCGDFSTRSTRWSQARYEPAALHKMETRLVGSETGSDGCAFLGGNCNPDNAPKTWKTQAEIRNPRAVFQLTQETILAEEVERLGEIMVHAAIAQQFDPARFRYYT